MDAPTLHGVSSLVNQRSAGLISSGEFFERLSGLDFVGLDDPTVRRSSQSWCNEALPVEPSLVDRQPLQVLTGPEAEALLRQPAKDLGAHGDPSTATPQKMRSPATESGHWTRDPPTEAAWGGSVEALGVPALLTERQATALVQELGGPGHPSCRSSARTEPFNASCDRGKQDVPLWSGSPISQHHRGADHSTSGDVSDFIRSLSIDVSSSHSKAVSSHTKASKHSSKSCSSASSGFSQRNEHWESRRAQKVEELRRQRDELELAECSFRPAVLPTAPSAYASMGYTVTRSTGDNPAAHCLVQPPATARRSQAARSFREEQEEKELRQCTFAPDVTRSASSFHLPARSRNSSVSEFANSSYQAEDLLSMRRSPRSSSAAGDRSRSKEGAFSSTFSPATNPIPNHMVCAQSYTRQNVFSRLSQPQSDFSQEASAPAEEPSSTKTQHSSCDHSQVPVATRSKDPLRDESFFNFLRRQNDFEEYRQERLAEVERFTAPVGSPELCAQSRRLARQRRVRQDEQQSPRMASGAGSPRPELELKTGITAKGCLSSRGPMPASVLWGLPDSFTGGTSSVRAGSASAPYGTTACNAEAEGAPLDQEATFRPSITPAASRRPGRSVSEMSSGDVRRREARLQQMRLEHRNEIEQKMPFAPQRNQPPVPGMPPPNVEGKLRLLEAPESFLSRMAEAKHEKEMRYKEAFEEKAAQELAVCTFTPEVLKGSPSFVRQMAETYKSVKSLESVEKLGQAKSKSPRPEWC